MNPLRNAAKLAGKKFYKGRPCIRGHHGLRYVTSGTCLQCEQEIFILRKQKRQRTIIRIPKIATGQCSHCGSIFEKTNNANQHCSTECRFWSKVKKLGPNDCWPWIGAIKPEGHGSFRSEGKRSGKVITAHRYAYQIGSGIPLSELKRKKWGDLYVCHTCDNPPCCNPKHLYLGSHFTNMRDMYDRGRNVGSLGKRRYGADIIKKVMKLRSEGLSQQSIADKTGVSQTVVSAMLRGKY